MEIEATAEMIYHVLNRPYRVRDRECLISASIGAAIFPDHATDVDDLLRKADTAMYAAKESGRSRVSFFEDEMDRIVQERLEMQHDLKTALSNGDFRLVYQPQLDIESGELVCFEALIRWHHSKRGQVPPTTFIPVLEEMGLIREVGRWVIDTALADFSMWQRQGLQLPRVAINVSSRQLTGGNLANCLARAIRKAKLRGQNLEIELTEHSLIENFASANAVLDDIRKLGVRVAIDDFGTGYSSLGYLQDLHFDVLKIDRGFVKSLPNEKSAAIIEAIVSVANALGKEVVAEGIDAEIQRLKLVEMGCRIGQGFLFSVPIPADEVIEWSRRLDVTSVIDKLVALDEERIAG
jgi:two-component system CheB/CheR fusion protein